MNLDVGVSIPVKCVQLAILTGRPSDEIEGGHSFAWGKGMFQVESVNGDEAIIRRLASQEIKALDQTKVLNPSQFRELSMWENPGAEIENPTNPQQTGEMVDPTRRDYAGGDVVPKDGVFPEELKSRRPALREPPKVDDEVRDDSVRYAALDTKPRTAYENLFDAYINLRGIDLTGMAMLITSEMSEGETQWGYVEYEEVLNGIINAAKQILVHMEKSREEFLREKGISPSDIE